MHAKAGPICKCPNERGGAMVELVILMLVFIPLILLPMYFQDALRYRLDAQEAVFSSAWDFAYGNYQDKTITSIAQTIAPQNQDIYKNLWSGNQHDKKNPAGPWADFSWRKQIQCSGVKTFATNNYPALAKAYHKNYPNGGLVTCTGAINVKNHYIPRVFLQEFAEENLFDPGKNDLEYPVYRFGIMVDPWTLQDHKDAETTEGKPGPNLKFHERVNFLWNEAKGHKEFVDAWEAFANLMHSKKISKSLEELKKLDNPTLLKLRAIHPVYKQRTVPAAFGPTEFWVSPYKDGHGDNYKKTFDNRRTYYLGCKRFEPNCKD